MTLSSLKLCLGVDDKLKRLHVHFRSSEIYPLMKPPGRERHTVFSVCTPSYPRPPASGAGPLCLQGLGVHWSWGSLPGHLSESSHFCPHPSSSFTTIWKPIIHNGAHHCAIFPVEHSRKEHEGSPWLAPECMNAYPSLCRTPPPAWPLYILSHKANQPPLYNHFPSSTPFCEWMSH